MKLDTNADTLPSQEQIDAYLREGRRMRAEAFRDMISSLGRAFVVGRDRREADKAIGSAATAR